LVAETYSGEVRHNSKMLHVEGLERYRCDQCGADPVLTDQIKRNQLRVCDARRRADGYFTGAEIKALRERFGLSQSQAADLFGGGANAFSKYERGEVVQSLPMDRLMRCVSAFPLLIDVLRQIADPTLDVGTAVRARVGQPGVSLNDPWYTSRHVHGTKVLVSERDVQSKVVSLPLKKVA
jgi:HTH-type transcriptional regulator / antitoxin MqsA